MVAAANKLVGSMPAKKEIDTSTYRGRFAARLRELRAGRDVKALVKKMAKLDCSISVATYYNWEAATFDPPIQAIPVLAKVLGVAIAELFPEK